MQLTSQPPTRHGRTLTATVGMAVALLICVPGVGWAVESQAASDADTGSVLEEVTVTATRTEESLNRVPISVSVETRDAMDLKGIKDFSDVVRIHTRRVVRQQRDQRHLDPRHCLLGRLRHHRNLYRRHADPDARPGIQSRMTR